MTNFVVFRGDCLHVLRGWPDNSVDSIVTDPPYGLEFMGKEWDAPWRETSGGFSAPGIGKRERAWPSYKGSNLSRCETCGKLVGQGGSPCVCESPKPKRSDAERMRAFQVWAETIFVECLRVLKPGGHLLSFGGSRTYHRMACAVEDAGFEIRDQIMWVYGSGFPKSNNGEWGGTALKPAHEPIVMARKPLIGTVEANWRRHGTAALNIDGCRVLTDDNLNGGAYAKERQGSSSPWAASGSLHKTTGQEFVQPTGRWPANLIHDGSDEVLSAFQQAAGQLAAISGTAPSEKTSNVYGRMRREGEDSSDSDNEGAVGFKMKPGMRRLDTGSAARFFYCAKASKADRDEGLEGAPDRVLAMSNQAKAELARGNMHEAASGMNTAKVRKNHHPTVKPTELMRYLCRLVTPPGGTVLDPFTGSGSTGKAAVLEGFTFIGIERDADENGDPLGYVDIARARITAAGGTDTCDDLFTTP